MIVYFLVGIFLQKEVEEMRKAVIVSHLTPEELKERMLASKDREQFQRWQVIFMMNTQKYRAEEVAELVGVSKGTVYQWIHLYNHKRPQSVNMLRGSWGVQCRKIMHTIYSIVIDGEKYHPVLNTRR